MGNKYSQISTEIFPQNYFTLALRQPDTIQILNAPRELIDLLVPIIDEYWQFGLKNERKLQFGVELKLNSTPFSNEPGSTDKVIKVNLLICKVLAKIINAGYDILTTGYLIKSFERSMWIFRNSSINRNREIHCSDICSIILEGWNKIIINNINDTLRDVITKNITTETKINIMGMQSQNKQFIIEMEGQPWDSHKTNSVNSPLVLLSLIKLILANGYDVLCKGHVTGFNDTLFFVNHTVESSLACDLNDLFILSLNQLEQVRTYGASSEIVNTLSATIKSKWKKGIHNDVIQGQIYTSFLNGSPWSIAEWDKDSSFMSRLLLIDILDDLSSKNWGVIMTMKLYRSQYDKSLFLFRKNANVYSENRFFTVSPHDVDRLCLTRSPVDLIGILKEKLMQHWNRGITEDNYENGCNEYILDGRPWYWTEEGVINLEAIGFFCWVIEHAIENGWMLLTSADICTANSYAPMDYIFYKL